MLQCRFQKNAHFFLEYMEQRRCYSTNICFHFIFIPQYLKCVTYFIWKLFWVLPLYNGWHFLFGFFLCLFFFSGAKKYLKTLFISNVFPLLYEKISYQTFDKLDFFFVFLSLTTFLLMSQFLWVFWGVWLSKHYKLG